MVETWKDVVGFDGVYQVSDMGRIRSFNNSGNRRVGKTRMSPRMLRGRRDSSGYTTIALRKDGRTHSARLHRLVAESFLGPSNGMVVDHVDRDKSNNRLDNLRYLTVAENIRHSAMPKTGFHGVIQKRKGTFYAQVWVEGKNRYIGTFRNVEAAVEARKLFIEQLNENMKQGESDV